MKIAVACEKEIVTEHFGHCENFRIYTVENNQVKDFESVPNPGHRPGFLPNFLNSLGVNVIIAGGMGGGAVQLFNENGIEIYTGISGKAIDAVSAYLNGSLKSTGSICQEHAHHNDCGN